MNASLALLVIDVQLGAFDGEAIPAMHHGDDLLARASKLVAAARATGIPVIFVQHCAPEGQLLIEGTMPWQIHPSVSPESSEAVVLKRESSAFEGTDLQSVLERQGVDTIVVCGLQSEYCVSNTCISALERGLDVYVAQDAHSTLSTDDDAAPVIIERQNRLLAERGATVQPTASLVELFTTT